MALQVLLTDPVWKHLGPRWKKNNMKVFVPGSYDDATGDYRTEPCAKTITIRMILTHTSGLSYGFDADGIENKVRLLLVTALGHRWPSWVMVGMLSGSCAPCGQLFGQRRQAALPHGQK